MFKLPHDGNRLCLHCQLSELVNRFVSGLDGAEFLREYRRSVPAETIAGLTDRQLLLGALSCALGTMLGHALIAENAENPDSADRVAKMVQLFNQSFSAECVLLDESALAAEPASASNGGHGPGDDKGTLH